jgi:hypothetical protein
MRFVRLWGLLLAGVLSACGGGNSSETTITGGGTTVGQKGPEVVIDQPTGPNTAEIVVDSGPASGFSLGVANLPYVSVKVCAPGSTTQCATIDHVFLDTGSIGFRVLRSAVAGLNLPPVNSGSSTVVACYPFVVGAVWGAMATADVSIGGETAANLPMQVIDDRSPAQPAATADCQKAANGDLLNTVGKLQAKGVLGIGMLRYDCGLQCELGDYSSGYVMYNACDAAGNCQPLAIRAEQQVQNPISQLAVNNNGTIMILPAVPDTGASLARGRLVMGIGTQTNNQIGANVKVLAVEPDPAKANYLYLTTTVNGIRYDNSYVDSGSNGLFFDDAALPAHCVGSGAGGAWYCPASQQSRSAVISDGLGTQATVNFAIANTDLLFATTNTAFANLGGAAGSANPGAFVWGLPFFFGRPVYTSIWGQALSVNGPWVGF